ncbi:MAG: protein kinase, partial [Deltaproteobacteria bacterium]|nr:protein kinase [Deltaproteobacteria bacterium]
MATAAPVSGAAGRRFHMVERLGSGAFGDVFLAEQESPGGFRRRVAIKVVREDLAGRTLAEAVRRMRDEARQLGLLAHRNIVQVLDLVRVGRDWVVVMEHVPGPDLDVVLAACAASGMPFPPRAAVEVVGA